MATRPPTPQQAAAACITKVQGYSASCKTAALSKSKEKCAPQLNQPHGAYGRCMDATYRRNIVKYCLAQIEACAKEKSDAICGYKGYPGCKDATFKAIMSWANGIDPSKKTSVPTPTPTPSEAAAVMTASQTQPELDFQAVMETESGLPLPTYSPAPPPPEKKGPMGVPWWGWAAGAATVGFLVLRK